MNAGHHNGRSGQPEGAHPGRAGPGRDGAGARASATIDSEAAERALISAATAYRYFPSADELWLEASDAAVAFEPTLAAAEERIRAAGDDPVSRLEALIRSVGFTMLDDQAPFRRVAKAALDQWFRQADTPSRIAPRYARGAATSASRSSWPAARPALRRRRRPNRARARRGRRYRRHARPHRRRGPQGRRRQQAMLDAARWMLTGALAELHPSDPPHGGADARPELG
jgi:hypothetical protein